MSRAWQFNVTKRSRKSTNNQFLFFQVLDKIVILQLLNNWSLSRILSIILVTGFSLFSGYSYQMAVM